MPPKKQQPNEAKKKQASVADKTFGMKNQKGGKAKRTIAQLEAQAKHNKNMDDKKKEAMRLQREKDKAAAEQARRDAAELFKPVQVQKVPFGVDPKTVLCVFFKKGNCEKGKRCKFSHDPAVERKAEKKDLYSDSRDADKKEADTMDNWDEEKLRSVVLSKHGNPRTTTDKVCKYFIEAVENQKYGWFWVCPNGGDKCMYKHSLPPGFVLKTKEQRAAEKALMDKSPLKTLTIEEFLDSERHKLTGKLTPVTPETFAQWKRDRLSKKAAEAEARKAKDATGRAMFESGKWKTASDDEESDDDDDQDTWNLDELRKETEDIKAKTEQERIAKLGGPVLEA
ncbi:hypothetical protein KEM56_001037 [Ascosphaera pollenicola]|nr:hypothetical protein KEM56_001037 [Ascosphaera pollenicola]